MKKTMLLSLLLLLAGVFFPCQPLFSQKAEKGGFSDKTPPAQASFYVKANGNDGNSGLSEKEAFKTLAKAITSAENGSVKTITVIGTLNKESENPNREGDSLFNIALKNNEQVTIRGKPGAAENEKAVLNAGGSGGRVLYIAGSSNVRLENISIRGGNTKNNGGGIAMDDEDAALTIAEGTEITGNTAALNGGGVCVVSGKLYMEGGSINGNKCGNFGGGVNVYENAECIMNGGTIHDNEAGYGGGALVYDGKFTMNGGTIKGNTAKQGGGICIKGSLLITNGSITENYAEELGGGVLTNEKFIMTGGNINGNKCGKNGGGVRVDTGSEFTMTGGAIHGNEAKFFGGGVYVADEGEFTMTGGALRGNEAEYGGGIYTEGRLALQNASVEENQAEKIGGGVYVDDKGEFTMTGGALRGNEAEYGGGIYTEGRLALQNASVEKNHAKENAGGVHVGEKAELAMTGCKIFNNEAKFGGGILIEGKAELIDSLIFNNQSAASGGGINVFNTGSLVMTGCKIFNNEAEFGGGGILIEGKAELIDSLIFNNQSAANGGGIGVFDPGSLIMRGGSINGNHANQNGGGITLAGKCNMSGVTIKGNQAVWGGGINSSASALLLNCVLSENRAFWGGAVYAGDNSQLEVKDSDILENYAFSGGGGIAAFLVNNETRLNNVRITHNKTVQGGAIYLGRGASLFINGGAMNNNTAKLGTSMYREKLSKLEFPEYRPEQNNEIFSEE